jgi:ketosteroid isomerase-like protein
MSRENVELVRGFFQALERSFRAYWDKPRSLVAELDANELYPEAVEAFGFVDPDVEWQTTFLGQTYHGRREIAKTFDDFLEWMTNYVIELEEVTDLGGDQVFAAIALSAEPRDGGMPMNTRFFDVVTLRAGKVVRLREFTSREDALEAAGPPRENVRPDS